MAVTAHTLLSDTDAASASSLASDSISPASDRMCVAFVQITQSSAGSRNSPTCSGWTQRADYSNSNNRNNFRIWAFTRPGGFSGAQTFDFAGQSQAAVTLHIVELDGDGDVWDVIEAETNRSTTGTSASGVYTGYSSGDAVVHNIGNWSFSNVAAPASGFTLMSNAKNASSFTCHTAADIDPSSTTVTTTVPASDDWVYVGLQLRCTAAAGAAPPMPSHPMAHMLMR